MIYELKLIVKICSNKVHNPFLVKLIGGILEIILHHIQSICSDSDMPVIKNVSSLKSTVSFDHDESV